MSWADGPGRNWPVQFAAYGLRLAGAHRYWKPKQDNEKSRS